MSCHKFSVQLPSSYPEITNNNSRPYAFPQWDKAAQCAKHTSAEHGLLGLCHRIPPSRAEWVSEKEGKKTFIDKKESYLLSKPIQRRGKSDGVMYQPFLQSKNNLQSSTAQGELSRPTAQCWQKGPRSLYTSAGTLCDIGSMSLEFSGGTK